MNAVMREEHPYEVPVVASESIEASVGILRNGLLRVEDDIRELKADTRSLRDKVDRNHETLSKEQLALRDRIDNAKSELSDQLARFRGEMIADHKALRNELTEDIKGLRTKIDGLTSALGATNVTVAKLGNSLKTLFWCVGSLAGVAALIEAVFRVGTALHWF